MAAIRLGSDFDDQYPAGSRVATECVLNLVRTGDLVQERVLRVLRKHGLTIATGHILGILEGAGESLPPGVISERLVVSPATVTGLLDTLQHRGLINRVRHPRDRRMLLVELTDRAREILRQFLPAVHRMEAELMDVCLSPIEQAQLLSLLNRLEVGLAEGE
jgi:DNA-binding MarR family transcriptional regulator